MAKFIFQAKSLAGKVMRGEIEAASDVEARIKLRAQQLVPVRVAPKGKKGKKEKVQFNPFADKVPPKELQIMTRQFATLINSGIPVVQSIDILSSASKVPALQKALGNVKNSLEGGKKLGDALAENPRVFDDLYCNMVKAGEEGGVLDTILNRLAEYIEKSVKLKAQITGALFYPAGIMVVAAIVIFAIMTYVIPQFEALFAGSGRELPQLTQIVIAMSHFVRDYWYVVIGGGIAIIVMPIQYYKTKEGKRNMDSFFIRIPVLGQVIQKGAIARFSRTLSTMLACGVGIIESLDIAAKVCGNYQIERSLLESKQSIMEGKSVTLPLGKNKYIPDMVTQMIGVGEQTGAMDVMLGKVADFYEDEVEYAVAAMTSMMEPLLMVVLGGTIAFLVIAMYLPIFDLASGF